MSLCIVTKFKNERHIMYEWVHHYLLEGVDCIIMIDDHSDDNYRQLNNWLESLIKQKKIQIFKSVTDSQVGDYNHYLNKIRKYHWVIYCDMDEFFFAVPVKMNLKKMLNTHFSKYDYIKVMWKLFTHTCKYQPKSVINNGMLTHKGTLTSKNSSKSGGIKCIAQTKYLKYVDIHYLEFDESHSRKILKKKLYNWHNPLIQINHYRTQSDEYLYGVKEIRGGGVNKDKYRGFKRHLDPNFNFKCNILRRKRKVLIKTILNRPQVKPRIYPESSFYKLTQSRKSSSQKKKSNTNKNPLKKTSKKKKLNLGLVS